MGILYIRDPKTGKKMPISAIKGENGDQMFVRFSAYADGTDMSEKWDAERDYMGIAFAATAPTDKAAYQWLQLASLSFGRYAEEGSAEKYLFFVGNGTGEGEIKPWEPWDGLSDKYQPGAIVSHGGKVWESTYDGQNVWEPGAVGIDERFWRVRD